MRFIQDFFVAAETGDLPAVSWLDPRFTDVESGGFGSDDTASDDHPPGDVSRGQQLVKQIYDALTRSPAWSKTLFVITYDEHGGFYDHVPPPGTPHADGTTVDGAPVDDDPKYTRYGVRVPAFVVSPWVAAGTVSHETFDHTSLIATMLRRFCLDAASHAPPFSGRADAANDVGSILSVDALPNAVAASPAVGAAGATPPGVTPPESFGKVLRQSLVGF